METRKVLIEKNGEYYRVIGAHYNNKELVRVEEIVESKLLKEALATFYWLLPDWFNVLIEDKK